MITTRSHGEAQYIAILRECLESGVGYDDRTKVGRHGVWVRPMRFDLSKGKIPLLTTKRIAFRHVFEELMWIMWGSTYEPHLFEQFYRPGSTHEDNPKKQIKIWREWATPEQTAKCGRKEGDLGPVYGHLWRNYGAASLPAHTSPVPVYDEANMRWITAGYANDGVDQLERLIDGIRKTPFGTRHIINGWDPTTCDQVAIPPCHTLCHFKVWPDADGKPYGLSSELYQRSCDMFLGVPFNMASYSLLTYLIAHVMGLKPVEFVHILGDTHVYSNHHDQIREQLSRWDSLVEQDAEAGDGKLYEKLPEEPDFKMKESWENRGFDMLNLLSITSDDIEISNYDPMPAIKAQVAV